VYYARNAVGAGVLVTDGDSILLVQRRDEPYRNQWQLPAGFVEYGERPEDTAVRETLEEVGLHVKVDGLVGAYFVGDDPRAAGILLVYRAIVVGGDLQPGDDAKAAVFFQRGSLPQQVAFQAQRDALRDWEEAGN
jgi:8-oxo-dGTP diphosphatase